MPCITRSLQCSIVALALIQVVPAYAQDAELDALNLQSAPQAAAPVARGPKIFLEGAFGNASQRYQSGSRDIGRVSLDFSHSARLAADWRAVISDRVDAVHPTDDGADAVVNSLREAYLSWQPQGGNTTIEFGRINLRYGPGYGYNPTDFFRDGSLRVLTTANPFALRENRLGTVMLRAQHLWNNGSLSAAYSPKLADRPSSSGWSADLGATNNRDRALIALGTQFSQRVSSQVLAYKVQGNSPTVGASATALLSDAAVAHVEWSRGRESDMLSRAVGLPGPASARNRFAAGLSYTTLSKLSITGEYHYNGFALSQSNWTALGAASPDTQVSYLVHAQRLQELASRRAYLIYLTQKGLGMKDLDLTAFLRVNADDHSHMAWIELRRHWPSFDLAFQLQQHTGRITSEFGVLPDRRVVQVLGTYYF
ncbi:MAG: hypothetical protein IPO19_13975 [Rhodoferax sp.]|nr:hypothetical protein [Rhodoferax sp.]